MKTFFQYTVEKAYKEGLKDGGKKAKKYKKALEEISVMKIGKFTASYMRDAAKKALI